MEELTLLWAVVKFWWNHADIESSLKVSLKERIKKFFSARKAKRDREQQYKTHFKRALREKLGAQADRHESSILAFQATNRVSELTIDYCLWTRKGTKSEMLTRYLGDETPSEKAIQMLMAEWYAEKNPALICRDGEALSVIQAMWYADNQATVSFLSENDRIMLNELQGQLNRSTKEIQDSVNKTVIREAQGIQISLHELREWIDTISQQLDKPLQDFATEDEKDNYLLYDANRIMFCGREEEMDRLTRFCEDEQHRVRWCQIIGAGGCGKSRLAYEFKYEMGKRGWAVRWFISADDVERFSILPEQDTLVIADYAQSYCASLVNNLLRPAENNNPAHKLRVILMDRQKIMFTGGADASDIHDTASDIFLPVLADKNLLKIMDELARVKGKSLESSERQKLLDRLKEIDPGLCRPLYALMLTAIACEGSMDAVCSMSAEDVLDHILKHDFDIMLSNLSNFYQRNASAAVPEGTLESDLAFLRELQTIATVNGNISLEDLENLYPSEWQNLQAIHETVKSRRGNNVLGRLLASVGLLEGDQILAVRPDILGERLVWKRYEENTANLAWMFSNDFFKRLGCMTFLSRFVSNYGISIPRPSAFWTHMEQMKENSLSRIFYAMSLAILTHKQDIDDCESTVEELRCLWGNYPREFNFSLEYIGGLASYSYQLDHEGFPSLEEMVRLKNLYLQKEMVAEQYADGLLNLSVKQELSEQETTVAKLKELREAHRQNTNIAISYSMGLYNLTYRIDSSKRVGIVAELRSVHEAFPHVSDIGVEYACGLFNLTVEQNQDDRAASIFELKRMHELFPEMISIAKMYARALVNQTNHQNSVDCTTILAELKRVFDYYSGEEEMAVFYIMGLFNYSYTQNIEECTATVAEMKRIQDVFSDNQEIATVYAQGCYYLLVKHTKTSRKDAEAICFYLNELFRVFGAFPNHEKLLQMKSNVEIWLNLPEGLNLLESNLYFEVHET